MEWNGMEWNKKVLVHRDTYILFHLAYVSFLGSDPMVFCDDFTLRIRMASYFGRRILR